MTVNFNVPIFKTIAECANLTGLAKYRIRKFVLEGKLKYVRAGTKYLINYESLIKYLQIGDGKNTESEAENDRIRRIYNR